MPTGVERLAGLEQRMTVVEEGVSNFRKHAEAVNEFITDFNARKDEQLKHSKRQTLRLNIIIALLGLLATYWALVWTVKGKPIGAIDPAHLFHSLIKNPVIAFQSHPPMDASN